MADGGGHRQIPNHDQSPRLAPLTIWALVSAVFALASCSWTLGALVFGPMFGPIGPGSGQIVWMMPAMLPAAIWAIAGGRSARRLIRSHPCHYSGNILARVAEALGWLAVFLGCMPLLLLLVNHLCDIFY